MNPLLPSFYLPPIEYFAFLLTDDATISIEEIYIKQTFRNRCCILSPNGIQKLIVPILHTGAKQMMKEVRISYAEPWQRNHCRSIKTAYSRSPFYEYFSDELNSIIEHRFEFLYELNQALINALLQFLGVKKKIPITESGDVNCFPGKTAEQHSEMHLLKPYNQVFSYKCEFQPNLSIIDLVFNRGLESQSYLASLNEN